MLIIRESVKLMREHKIYFFLPLLICLIVLVLLAFQIYLRRYLIRQAEKLQFIPRN